MGLAGIVRRSSAGTVMAASGGLPGAEPLLRQPTNESLERVAAVDYRRCSTRAPRLSEPPVAEPTDELEIGHSLSDTLLFAAGKKSARRTYLPAERRSLSRSRPVPVFLPAENSGTTTRARERLALSSLARDPGSLSGPPTFPIAFSLFGPRSSERWHDRHRSS